MKSLEIGQKLLTQDDLRVTPRLAEPAPDFQVNTTHGPKKLSDYRGSWLLLFSHPADFTPVCTSELVALSKAYEKFKALNCELLDLSIDSNYSHLAWIQNIKDNFGVEVPFPIIEDVSMWVASMYGMMQPGASETSTVRGVFIIDPEGILRAMLYYPIGVGRSVAELLRMVAAIQVCEQHQVDTPEGWQPGNKVIVRAPQTAAEAAEQRGGGYEYTDWYYCLREL